MQPVGPMKGDRTGTGPLHIASFGHSFLAASLIALGILGLVRRDFVPIWSGVPKGFPARVALAYLCAVVSLGSGVGLLWRRAAGIAARVLLAYLALWMLVFRLPLIVRNPASNAAWWVCGETAAMIAGAWVLVVWFTDGRDGKGLGFVVTTKALAIARALLGFGLIMFGLAHFTFLERTVSMVPAWLPWHLGWAWFTGGSLIAAGAAIIVGVWAPLAAMLAAVELSLFTLLVWVPLLVAGAKADTIDEFIDSCALTAAAWLVAESYRRRSSP